jgi:TM2 domain-containing membrane protein YozV
MTGQVWVIESEAEKRRRRAARAEAQRPIEPDRNPALAATLSLLIWGMGQFYTRRAQSGFLFLLLMVNFLVILGLAFFYWNFFAAFLDRVQIGRTNACVVIGTLCVASLLIWVFNILHAYYSADNKRAEPFGGIEHPLLSTLCSALIPGWGQILNGQPKKALIYLIFSAVGLAAGTVTILAAGLWPRLNSVDDRIAVEWMVVGAAVVAPALVIIWLIAIYDAAKVGWDPVKKEPLRKRFEYAINRIRIKGLARGLVPQIKVFLMLTLFLILSAVLSYYYFPVRDYAPVLQSLEKTSADRRMVLTPYLIDHLLQVIANEDRSHRADPISD